MVPTRRAPTRGNIVQFRGRSPLCHPAGVHTELKVLAMPKTDGLTLPRDLLRLLVTLPLSSSNLWPNSLYNPSSWSVTCVAMDAETYLDTHDMAAQTDMGKPIQKTQTPGQAEGNYMESVHVHTCHHPTGSNSDLYIYIYTYMHICI